MNIIKVIVEFYIDKLIFYINPLIEIKSTGTVDEWII